MAEPGDYRRKYTLNVPLDASSIESLEPEQGLRVVARAQDGSTASDSVKLDTAGRGVATLGFAEQPGALHIAVGPDRATDEELLASQTITVDVPGRVWSAGPAVDVKPILIAPYFWYWWLRWCREFVIRGRVVCPDGSPVPAAQVCAYDVDWWFIWSSKQLVGCTTTDINGAFEIRFRWCCGFWPWWWWRHRVWELDEALVERVAPILRRDPTLRFASATNQPSLAVFEHLLGADGVATTGGIEAADVPALGQLRGRLLEKLPPAPELESLHVWPWWPWQPWWDCTPDIVFRVTQDCVQPGKVILDEGIGDTRWNVPNPLDVTLVASEDACCRTGCPDPPCEEGECLVITSVCSTPINAIGGNLAALPAPVGYAAPGAVAPGTVAYNGDRPFGGVVTVTKNAGDMVGVDYYELEYSDGGPWSPLPPGAAVDFSRHWLLTDGVTWTWGSQLFPFTTISGHEVVESREHFEATGPYGDWYPPGGPASDRFWVSNMYLVAPIDSSKFPDGEYRFRVVAWKLGAGGQLEDRRVLPLCGTDEENELVLRFDNRVIDALSHDPSHNCDGVHECTTEPDTHISGVRIDGQQVDPCGTIDASTGTVEIDFEVHDPDGHLAFYSLQATYGLNQVVNLLDRPSVMMTAAPGAISGHAGLDALGTYGRALDQGAVAPHWFGGKFTLTVPAEEAFPEPCCYQLELRGYKRTIVTCGYDYPHRNLTEYTLGVGVCPPRDEE